MQQLLAIGLVLASAAAASAQPSVQVTAGMIHGTSCPRTDKAVAYHGIPFAQPPTGALRFAPPRAYVGSYPGGSLQAIAPAPSCPQFLAEFATPGKTSEDCLFIDVWTPVNATECKDLPVRVYIYGGFNQAGGISDSDYDGCNIADNGAIAVSINYRVGPLGFFALEKDGLPGNQGIQDVLLGLQWVQDNIKAFGGDPKKVLLYGESAGAIDTFAIATLPEAPELFNAAAFESGGGRLVTEQSAVEQISRQFASHLNCTENSAACLRSRSVAELKQAYNVLPLQNTYALPTLSVPNTTTPAFNPSVDGRIIPRQTNKMPSRVPSIFGCNSMEGTIFALESFGLKGPKAATAADYTEYLQQNFGPDAATVEHYYPLRLFKSTPYPAFYALATVMTDAYFICPTRRGVERTRAAGIPVWLYLFSHTSNCAISSETNNPDLIKLLGPTHTVEVPYVFGHISGLPLPGGNCSFTPAEVKISNFMLQAWTSMAATQSPAPNDKWPAWTTAQQSHGINITDNVTPSSLNFDQCELWDALDARGSS